jgi:multidrug resistance efflux pump
MLKILEKPFIAVTSVALIAIVAGTLVAGAHSRSIEKRFAGLSASSTIVADIAPSQDLVLSFPTGGRIKSVAVKAGDFVKKGDVLASLDAENAVGAINQAKGAYTAAVTAYNKLVNGASAPDIEVAKVALQNAETAYDNTVAQQKVLVGNAVSAMMSSGLVATPVTSGTGNSAPTISGTYGSDATTAYTVKTYGTGAGMFYSVSGPDGTGDYAVKTTPTPLGTRGLYIQFPANVSADTSWTVSVPNTQSANAQSLVNARDAALAAEAQAVASAKGAVDAAQAALDQKLAGARSEDLDIARAQVESTLGALQVAQGAYNNTVIVAPADGKIANVSIVAGQTAAANAPAIEIVTE